MWTCVANYVEQILYVNVYNQYIYTDGAGFVMNVLKKETNKMAETKEMKVEVLELSKFGFKDGQGVYIGWSKNFKEADKAQVVPGRSFNMEMYIADSGKKYVNKVLSQLNEGKPTVKETNKAIVKAVVGLMPKTDAPMTREDWDSKDRRIGRAGVIQAAVQAVSGLSTQEDLFKNAEELAKQMLKFVNGKGD